VQLSKLTGTKPVVLVFGNFSCGPFRTIFPEADSLRERYKDKANFGLVWFESTATYLFLFLLLVGFSS
jgi:hypothetical protein